MEINGLPKRNEIKKRYRDEKADSPIEAELKVMLEEKIRTARIYRQFNIKNYFVDLAYPEAMVAIEYDGKDHWDRPVYDYKRHQEIIDLGWTIFRAMNKGGGWYSIIKNYEQLALIKDRKMALEILCGAITGEVLSRTRREVDILEYSINKRKLPRFQKLEDLIKKN